MIIVLSNDLKRSVPILCFRFWVKFVNINFFFRFFSGSRIAAKQCETVGLAVCLPTFLVFGRYYLRHVVGTLVGFELGMPTKPFLNSFKNYIKQFRSDYIITIKQIWNSFSRFYRVDKLILIYSLIVTRKVPTCSKQTLWNRTFGCRSGNSPENQMALPIEISKYQIVTVTLCKQQVDTTS